MTCLVKNGTWNGIGGMDDEYPCLDSLAQLGGHVRGDETGGDGVAVDVATGVLARDGLGQADDASLRAEPGGAGGRVARGVCAFSRVKVTVRHEASPAEVSNPRKTT